MTPKDAYDPTDTVTNLGNKARVQKLPKELIILYSADEGAIGKKMPIGQSLNVGRISSDSAHMVIDDRSLSRLHATLGLVRGRHTIRVKDNDSKNGTYVNGERIQETEVSAGAVVRFGTTIGLIDELAPGETPQPDGETLGRAPSLLQSLAELDKVAPTDLPVLIQAESGTGKELAANRIHNRSGRTGPFVAINCGAIPENLVESTLFGHAKGSFTGATHDQSGVFASAEGGTLFLDEVGELPITVQPKLLRALETHEFTPVGRSRSEKADIRIVSATNRDLMQAVGKGLFRLDLQARLEGYRIKLPPLRERKLDILLLARHFLDTFAPRKPLLWTADFAETILLYSWPTNIRGLRSVMQRIALLHEGDEPISSEELPEEIRNPDASGVVLTPSSNDDEATATTTSRTNPNREDLISLSRRFHGNVAQIAAHLGKDRKQVYRWFQKHDVDPSDYR